MARPVSGSTPASTPSNSSNPHDTSSNSSSSTSNAPATPSHASTSNSAVTPNNSATPVPSVTNSAPRPSSFLTDAEILRFVADHMDTGLPPEHHGLLELANGIIVGRRNTNAARPFEYVGNNPGVKSIISRLQNAAAQGPLPNPYPISTDPLDLATWASTAKQHEVNYVARQFPSLQNALIAYWNKGVTD